MTTAANRAGPGPAAVAWEGGVLVVTRALEAPPELVFRAWTEPEHFAAWYGPLGSTLTVRRLDARPGGALHYCHRFGDEFGDVWIGGTYRDVAPPGRLAFDCWFADAAGNRVERPGFPAEMSISVRFDRRQDGTLVTIRQTGLVRDQGEVQGWLETLDRLAAHVADPSTRTGEDR